MEAYVDTRHGSSNTYPVKKSYPAPYTNTYVQVELDNTAADFRRLHTERQDLVRQWQNAIDGMRRRDDEINAVGEKYAAARQVRASRIETLAQNAARLKMQKNDNKEVMPAVGARGMC